MGGPKLFKYPTDPNFPLLTAIDFDRSQEGLLYGNEDYFRIGDSSFSISPDDIFVEDISNNHVEPVLRTIGGIAIANGFVEKNITVNLTFPTSQDIFGYPKEGLEYDVEDRRYPSPNQSYLQIPKISPSSLAALIAQIKRTPIMPVVNSFLNTIHHVDALIVDNISVSTMQDNEGMPVPNVISVVLSCRAMDTAIFCPTITRFSSALNYPLLRWWWRQEYAEVLPGQYNITAMAGQTPPIQPQLLGSELQTIQTANDGKYHVFTRTPANGMTGDFQFLTINTQWLDDLGALRQQYNRLQAFILSDEYKLKTDKGEKAAGYLELQDLLNNINDKTSDDNARMDPVDMGEGVVLTGISCSLKNHFSTVRTSNTESPAYQHMSQGNVRITATFWAEGMDALDNIKKMVEKSRSAAREARFELIAGFVGFENEITSLMGVHSVVFTNIATQNVPDYPQNYIITLEMMSFERNQKQIEALKGAANMPRMYMDQVAGNNSDSPNAGKVSSTDPRYLFWQRYLNQYDDSNTPKKASAKVSNTPFDEIGRPLNAWFNGAYIQEAKEQMAFIELYPDLRLPTYERLQFAFDQNEIFGTTNPTIAAATQAQQKLRWQYWTNMGYYLDPDFYVDYPNSKISQTVQNISGDVTQGASAYLAAVAESTIDPNQVLNIDGSISGVMIDALLDSHPPGALYGVDPPKIGPGPGSIVGPPDPGAIGPQNFTGQENPGGEKNAGGGFGGAFGGNESANSFEGLSFDKSGTSIGDGISEFLGSTNPVSGLGLSVPDPTTTITAPNPISVFGFSIPNPAGLFSVPTSNPFLQAAQVPADQSKFSTSGEAGPARGRTRRSGLISVPGTNQPTPDNPSGTNTFRSTFEDPQFNETVTLNGQTINQIHPSGTLFTNDIVDTKAQLTKIPDLPNILLDHAKTVLGKHTDTGKDNRSLLNMAIMNQHPVDVGYRVQDEQQRLIAMAGDIIDNDVSGRFVQAFPTYVFQLLDEGPRIGFVNLLPNFYALDSIQSIDIINDRRDPAHTARIELINTYGNLNSYTQSQLSQNAVNALTNYNGDFIPTVQEILSEVQGVVSGQQTLQNATVSAQMDIRRWFDGMISPLQLLLFPQNITQQAAAIRRKQSGQVMLTPGVRIHIRLGYGSNGSKFPVAFNGRITDVGLGEKVEIIAMGDGVELAKLIPSAEQESNTINPANKTFLQGIAETFNNLIHGNPTIGDSMLNQTYEPREIICNMLSSHDGSMFDWSLGAQFWNNWKTQWYNVSGGGFFQGNPLGICHFGNPYLFDWWEYAYGTGAGSQAALEAALNVEGPRQLTVHNTVSSALNIVPHLSLTEILAASVLLPEISLGLSSVIGTGEALSVGPALPIGLGLIGTKIAVETAPVTKYWESLVGPAATMFNHDIVSGYGETGENVYAIYTPFDKFLRQAGSYSSAVGIGYLAWQAATAASIVANVPGANTGAVNAFGASQQGQIAGVIFNSAAYDIPELPDVGSTPHTGIHPPGTAFNMYTKNKTVWDIITTMAQYFPPYVAAVVPFEYRSTLFFGTQYFQFRHDYKRVTAYDLGTVSKTATPLDKFYGYPLAYKTKPFCQFHYYDSNINLLDNNLRATDEDTYTDVIAMWYNGQGYGTDRPTPMPVMQTVDRQVGNMYRKTAIVNTDLVGLDTPPTAAAVIGSLGTDYLAYMAENVTVPGTDWSIAGTIGHWVTEENMRQMARAILRDYQKLMYQGQILVLGDPTVKPHDLIYINDDYTDIRGLAGVRRVIHHFGIDTGFVTSIEPDLLCEVKGENMWLSIITWWGGFIATNLVARTASVRLLAASTRRFIRSIDSWGVKVKKTGSLWKTIARTISGGRIFGIPENVIELNIAGKGMSTYEPETLKYTIRKLILDGLKASFNNANFVTKGINNFFGTTAREFADLGEAVAENARTAGSMLGKDAMEKIASEEAAQIVMDSVSKALDEEGFNGVKADLLEAFAHNLAGVVNKGVPLETIIKRSFAQYIGTRALSNYLLRDASSIEAKILAGAASTLGDDVKAIIAKSGAKTIQQVIADATADGAAPEAIAALEELVPLLARARLIAAFNPIGLIATAAFEILCGYLQTAWSRYWDDQTSLQICFLKYRGAEFQAGLNGHSETIVLKIDDNTTADNLDMTVDDYKMLHSIGAIGPRPIFNHIAEAGGQIADLSANLQPDASTGTNAQVGAPAIAPTSPSAPLKGGKTFSPQDRAAVVAKHSPYTSTVSTELLAQATTFESSGVHDSIIQLLQAASQAGYNLQISAAAKYSHPSGAEYGSPHLYGRAIDIIGISYNGGSMTPVESSAQLSLSLINWGIQYGVGRIGLGGATHVLLSQINSSPSTIVFRDNDSNHIHMQMES